MEKKSERLEVRLGYKEKIAFTEACETQGDTPSGAIRRFINGYVRRSDSDVLSEAWRRAASRSGRKFVTLAIAIGLSATAIFVVYKNITQLSDSEIFNSRDYNKDAVLSGDELGPTNSEVGILGVLDLDNSGGITLEEFQAQGRMIYVLSGPKDDSPNQYRPREGTKITLVKYKFEKQKLSSGTYTTNETNLKNIDRIVHWHDGGETTVMQGPIDVDIGHQTVVTQK